jgi:hypothetical protein
MCAARSRSNFLKTQKQVSEQTRPTQYTSTRHTCVETERFCRANNERATNTRHKWGEGAAFYRRGLRMPKDSHSRQAGYRQFCSGRWHT